MRILVVEDDVDTAAMICRLLQMEGYQVLELHSGVKALELIAAVESGQDAPFDVALLDIMMPQVNGYQVCQEIRKTERLGYIPIIMVTALSSTEDMVRGLNLGADDYLVKPFNSRELLARVRAALRIRNVDRAMRQRNWQLALLNTLNDAIGESLDRRAVLHAGLEQLLSHLDLCYAVAFLRDRPTGEISTVFHFDGDRWVEEKIQPSDGLNTDGGAANDWQERDAFRLALEVVQSGQRQWQTQAHGWPTTPPDDGSVLAGRYEASLDWRACVPLKTKSPTRLESAYAETDLIGPTSRVLGALLVGAPTDRPMIDLDLLTAIGNLIGQALEKSYFYQQARDRGEELTALFDSISDLIYVVDESYSILAFNAALGQWLTEHRIVTPDKLSMEATLKGQTCYRVLHHRDEPCEKCLMAQALHTSQHIQWTEQRRPDASALQATQPISKVAQKGRREEVFTLRPTGAREEWEISAYPIQRGTGRPLQAIVLARDVTERRMLEASLSQADKLAALGQLAAGLAHEINNPLTAIVANVQLLLMMARPDDPSYESLGLIKQASDRAVRVVRNLLDFSRQEQYEFHPMDLNASLRATLELIKHQFLMTHISIVEELAPSLPPALGSRDHLQGVWLNLLINARDAVTQSTQGGAEPTVWVRSHLRPDGLLEAVIADNGPGIPPDQINRIFEPFFTTKDPGKGTGLGLSTSYQVIKQHGGQMLVDSEEGVGTTFRVLLKTKT